MEKGKYEGCINIKSQSSLTGTEVPLLLGVQLLQRVPAAARRAQHGVLHARLHPRHDALEQQLDGAVHVLSALGAGLEVRQVVVPGELARAVLVHEPLLLQVTLVAAQHYVGLVVQTVRLQLFDPIPHF